jgi:hypothetical protein
MRTLFSAKRRQSCLQCPGWTRLTVDCEIPKSCAGCPLHLDIGALEQEQYWFEGVAVDLPDICSPQISED